MFRIGRSRFLTEATGPVDPRPADHRPPGAHESARSLFWLRSRARDDEFACAEDDSTCAEGESACGEHESACGEHDSACGEHDSACGEGDSACGKHESACGERSRTPESRESSRGRGKTGGRMGLGRLRLPAQLE